MLRCNVAIHVVGVLLRLTDLGGEHHKCVEIISRFIRPPQ